MIVETASEPSVNAFPPCFLFIATKVRWPFPVSLDICEYVAVAVMKTQAALLIDKLNADANSSVLPVSLGQQGQLLANMVFADLITASSIKMKTRSTGGVDYFDPVFGLAATVIVLLKTTLFPTPLTRRLKG